MTQDTNKERFFKLDLGETGISYVRAMSPEAARESVLQEHLSDGKEVGEATEIAEADFDDAAEGFGFNRGVPFSMMEDPGDKGCSSVTNVGKENHDQG